VTKLCQGGNANIVEVFQFGILYADSAFYFIDMELCEFSLSRYIDEGDVPYLVPWQRLRLEGKTLEHICTINEHIMSALDFIHSRHEVHRDLTPHNGAFL